MLLKSVHFEKQQQQKKHQWNYRESYESIVSLWPALHTHTHPHTHWTAPYCEFVWNSCCHIPQANSSGFQVNQRTRGSTNSVAHTHKKTLTQSFRMVLWHTSNTYCTCAHTHTHRGAVPLHGHLIADLSNGPNDVLRTQGHFSTGLWGGTTVSGPITWKSSYTVTLNVPYTCVQCILTTDTHTCTHNHVYLEDTTTWAAQVHANMK